MTPTPLEKVTGSFVYTEMEAAILLNMGRSTLSAKRKTGAIRYCKYGDRKGIRYTKNHIEEYQLKTQSL